MNTIYRIVWNAITCRWVVASELAKGRTKSASRKAVAITAVAFVGTMASGGAFALNLAGQAALIVNDIGFGITDVGVCNGISGDGGGPAANGFQNGSCSAAVFGGYNNILQKGSVVVANNAMSVGGYQFINGNDTNGNALTITANGANILMTNGKVAGLANGTANGDSVNVSQLTPVVTALGGGAAINGATGVVTAPSYALANANTIDGTAGAATDVGTGFSKVDTALGKLNTSLTNINNGGGIKYFHANSVQVDSSATGAEAIAIGGVAIAGGSSAVALGAGAVASTTNSVALGANSTTTANLATAGYNPGTAALSGTASAANGEVSLGSAGKERRLTNVAAGANATDAVNVSQLQSEDAKVNNVASTTASALGTTVGANGAINAPSYALTNANSIGGTAGAATTVSSGFRKVDTALGTLNTAVTAAQTTANTANTTANKGWNLSTDAGVTSQNIAPGGTANFAAGTNATVARSGNTVTMGVVNNPTFSGTLTANGGLTVGAGQAVSMGGNKATNVAGGTLSAASTDAVNGSQLYATNQQVAQNTTDIAGNTTSITNLQNNITNGTAGLVQQAAAGADLTVGKGTDGAAVDFADKNGNARTLKNVTAGVANTDAVNMSQLNATNANVAGNTTAITNLGTRVTTTEGNISTINTTIAGMNGQLADAVMYDSAAHDTVTLGNAGAPVQVTNVKNGALSAASSDAVNGSQLYATNQQVVQNTSDIAGNTTAIAGNTTSISNITNQINNGTVGLVQQAAAGADLTVGKGTDGAAVDFADVSGNTRTLKNVTAGVANTDAVNMSQLNATNANVAGNTTAITNLGTRVTTTEGNISTINTTIAGMNGQLADAVMYDSAAHDTVTLGNAGTPVQVTNVKSGALSAASTDAVNGSQLYATNQQVAQNTSDIAGNTTAIAGNTTSISNITNQINNGTVGLVQQAAAGADLTVGKGTDGVAVDIADKNGNTRTLKNVTAGVAATDAVNMSQLNTTNANVAANTTNIAGNTTAITNLGSRVTTTEGNISTINTTIAGMNGQLADAVMYDSAAHDTVTLGNAGTPVQVTNVKNGALSAASSDAVNGSQLYATNQQVAQNTSDIAGNTTAIAGNTTSISNITNQINNGTVGLVQQAAAGADLTVGKGTDGVAVDFADMSGNTRTLKNVTAGVAATDAVNMSQLNATNANVTRVEGKADQQGSTTAAALGGGASYSSTTGAIVAPSYTVHNADGTTTTANDVGTAVTNIDGRVTQNTSDINTINTQINSGTIGLVQQAAAGANLTVGKSTDGAAVDFQGTAGARKLLNVADGTVATGSKDAVNGGQLAGVSQSVANAIGGGSTVNSDGSISAPSYTVHNADGTTTTASDVGTAVSNIDGRVVQNTTDIAGNTTAINNISTQINSGTIGLVQQAAAGADLTVGKGTDGVAVDFADKNGNTRTLKNVTAGVANTDAVNVSQLNTTNANVTRVEGKADQQGSTTAAALGGGASYSTTTGAISAPSYTLHNADGTTTTASDVGTAVSNIDGRVVQNTTDIAGNTSAINTINTQINSGTIGLVQQASAGANLTVGKSTDGAAVDFQGTAGARKLLNVADGTVASGSKDAVNGGQLAGVSQSVADAIGGGSTVNSDGSISAPSYVVHNANGSTTTVNNVGGAITNLDGRVTQNTTDISTINTTINGMNGQLADAVKYDSAAHDKVTLGNAGTPVQVTNVKDGALSATSSDAVNGSQLYATNQQVAQNTGDIANINSSINNMNTVGLKYVQVNSTAAGANAAGTESVAVGGNSKASAANAVAIGNGAQASQANSVALGAGSVADRANSVSVGSVGQERQVTNVAAGNVSATSTDAVNGSQLNATNQAVTNLDGRVTNVENTVNTMAGAVSNVTNITSGQAGMFQVSKDSNSTQPVASGSKSTAGGNGAVASGSNSTALGNAAVASADNSVAVGANSVADRSNSVSMGSAGHERQVTNVAAGTANTDAVNVGQLKAAGVMNADGSTNTAVTYDTNADGSSSVTLNGGGNAAVIHNVAPGTSATDAATVGQVQQAANWAKSYTDQAVRNVGRQANGGVASAMAMSSIPQAMVNGGHSIGAGVGNFGGQSSVAVGMSAMSATGKFAVKLNLSATTGGQAGVGVGASYNW